MPEYDLENRTLVFAICVRDFLKTAPYSLSNKEYAKQLIRSSASVGANYIEANEALSKKDFIMRAKICRKEAKESIYWLRLIEDDTEVREKLIKECRELMLILGSMIRKLEK